MVMADNGNGNLSVADNGNGVAISLSIAGNPRSLSLFSPASGAPAEATLSSITQQVLNANTVGINYSAAIYCLMMIFITNGPNVYLRSIIKRVSSLGKPSK